MRELPNPYLKPTVVPEEIAEFTGMHVDSVRLACAEGQIPVWAGPLAEKTQKRLVPRSQAYLVRTTWLYENAGLPIPPHPNEKAVA